MVGHRMWMAARRNHEAWATVRGRLGKAPWTELFEPARTLEGVRAEDGSSLDRALEIVRPEVVINALGVIKQRPEGMDPGAAFTANCFVPHHLRVRCDSIGARLIQVSTDCVFTG